jgi:hypothetical protein
VLCFAVVFGVGNLIGTPVIFMDFFDLAVHVNFLLSFLFFFCKVFIIIRETERVLTKKKTREKAKK